MSFSIPLPPAMTGGLQPDEILRLSVASDLNANGTFGKRLLAITDRRILAGDDGGIRIEIAVSSIKELAVDEMFGVSRLMARLKAAEVPSKEPDPKRPLEERELIVYSANRIGEFAVVVRNLNAHLAGAAWAVPEDPEPAVCPKCLLPLAERGTPCQACVPKRAVIGRLIGRLKPYRTRAIALIACTFVTVGVQMVPPLAMKEITDQVIIQGKTSKLAFWLSLMAICFLSVHISRFAVNRLNCWIAYRVVANLRSALHAKLQRLSMRYHGRHESGELVSRMTNDTTMLGNFLIDGLPFFLVNVTSFLVIGGVLISIDPFLALLVFLPVPVLIGGGSRFWRKLLPLFHKQNHRWDLMHSLLSESIRGVKTVKGSVQEERRHREFVDCNDNLRGVQVKTDFTWFGFHESMAVTMSIGTIAVWAIGSGRITDGRMSFGALIAFISYMNIFYGPLQWFTAILNWLTRTLAGAQRIFQVLDHTSADIDQPGATPLPRTQGGIRLENIRFSYERGKEVIKGVDLDIKPGEMIGLIGKSGSGKSTLINLICRFYEPDSGRVLVDGLDLKTITFESWRRQIGVVMQEPFLFNASIADNIRYSNPDAPFSAVVAAARAAAAHDFIVDKEEGYDTLVGEGGAALSGGEKQRIAIARAILADPPVLILDEATSSVDGETEKAIQSAITTLVKNRTTIAIAHRLATLRNADRLVVLEDGKMVESGTHEELLAKPDGKFAKMVQTQTEINKLRSEQNVWNA